jgi:hypothetical protein
MNDRVALREKTLMKRSLVFVCVLGLAANAAAQQRPLVTEDPETVGAGVILLEGGVEVQRGVFYPLSGLEGNLLRLPTLGISIGLSSIAELQIDGGFYDRLDVTRREPAPFSARLDFTGDRTSDVADLFVATKIRLLSETAGRPAIGLRLATQLPTASNESGLGLDTTDFFASILLGKTTQSIRVVGNVGLGILGNPIAADQQNDALTYGFSVARAVRQGLEVVGEINGRMEFSEIEAPPGTESRSALRLGGRFTRGTVRVDGGILIGITSNDPSFGLTAGFTWVFRGFTVP